jgi:ribosomal protein S18 acetylase RimI-like enzyme
LAFVQSDPHVRIVLRPAGPADAEGIAEAHWRSWRDAYRHLLPQALNEKVREAWNARHWQRVLERMPMRRIVLVAEAESGEIAGVLEAGRNRRLFGGFDSEVYALYVSPSYQHLGVGSALMGSAARVFQSLGGKSILVWSLATNLMARRFYEKLGGRPAGQRWGRLFGLGVPEAAYGWDDLHVLTGDRHRPHTPRDR